METKIINVGNSKGLIIPAKFLKLLGLKIKVQLEMENNSNEQMLLVSYIL